MESRHVEKYILYGGSRSYKINPNQPNKPTGRPDLAVYKRRYVFGEKCLSPCKIVGGEGDSRRFSEDKGEYFMEDHLEANHSKCGKKKNFWRTSHNLLPTKDNLLKRKVVDEPMCPICEKEPETVFHALRGCPAAMDIWGCSERTFQKCAIVGGNFTQTAENVLSRCGLEDFGLFVQLAR